MTPVSFHPLAELFPPIEGDEFEALVEDIRRHGLHEPVILYRNQILDGRNRYRASLEAGVQCRFEHYEGSDPAAYVVSLNLKRRHLNESQRAMVAAKLATLKPGDNQHSEGLPIGRGSELLNVGERTVARAREVQDRGAPELQRVVERGAISVSAAVDVATRPVEEQREIVARGKKGILEAAKLATLKLGDNQHSEGPSIEEASRLLNVGHASVERAKTVQRAGAPELVQVVERGRVSVSAAADIATLAVEQQQEIVARGEREILEAAKAIRGRKAEQRRTERIERLAVTCNQNAPFPRDRRYAVLYADPPWQFRVYDENSSIASEHGAAGVHYPCMSTDAICALPVKELATDAAALFLWTTAPHLPEALQVITAWGFEYKTHAVWVKDWIGVGFWVGNQHEILLVAAWGDMPTPAPANRPSSVITAPRREHSRKPDEVYALIERMYPELPKIELFARQTRPGWAAWGNEVETAPADGIPNFLRRTS